MLHYMTPYCVMYIFIVPEALNVLGVPVVLIVGSQRLAFWSVAQCQGTVQQWFRSSRFIEPNTTTTQDEALVELCLVLMWRCGVCCCA